MPFPKYTKPIPVPHYSQGLAAKGRPMPNDTGPNRQAIYNMHKEQKMHYATPYENPKAMRIRKKNIRRIASQSDRTACGITPTYARDALHTWTNITIDATLVTCKRCLAMLHDAGFGKLQDVQILPAGYKLGDRNPKPKDRD